MTAYDGNSTQSIRESEPKFGYSSLSRHDQTVERKAPFAVHDVSPIISKQPLETELTIGLLKTRREDLNVTLELEEVEPSGLHQSFSFNRALSETQYFSFEREQKSSPSKAISLASRLLEQIRGPDRRTDNSFDTDLVLQNTSNESVDSVLLGKFHVIKNHLKLNIFVSFLLFIALVMPYYRVWYSEFSSVPGAMVYFGRNRVWIPVQHLALDPTTGTYVSEVEYEMVSLAEFMVGGCAGSLSPD